MLNFSNVAFTSSQSLAEHAEFYKYMNDWHAVDFYKYNPIDDSTFMNYCDYYKGREAGTLPAPDKAEVLKDTIHPMHVERDGV